jgi:NitT/TauT family transport system ATP-binding protein
MSVAVKLDAVTKRFGTVAAVDNVSCIVEGDRFVSIVGPSGCGKSTLLRLVAGLIAPSEGLIEVRGEGVRKPIRDAGMVFQSAVLLPWRTLMGNILFVAEMRGRSPALYHKRAQELVKLTRLDGFEHHYPFELSAGSSAPRSAAPCCSICCWCSWTSRSARST